MRSWSCACVLLAGCSSDFDPSTVSSKLTATIRGTTVDLKAEFIDNSSEKLDDSTASAYAKIGDQEVRLIWVASERQLEGSLELAAPLEVETPIDVTMSIERTHDEDDDVFEGPVLKMKGATPAPFTVMAPTDAHGSDPDGIVVTWAPTAADSVAWTVTDCQGRVDDWTPFDGDGGAVAFFPNVFLATGGEFPCDVRVEMGRVRTTVAATTPFKSSSVVADLRHAVDFHIDP